MTDGITIVNILSELINEIENKVEERDNLLFVLGSNLALKIIRDKQKLLIECGNIKTGA